MTDLRGSECNFCGKPKSRVRQFIRSEYTSIAISGECVGICLSMIGKEDHKLFEQMVEQARSSD